MSILDAVQYKEQRMIQYVRSIDSKIKTTIQRDTGNHKFIFKELTDIYYSFQQ